MRSFLSALRYSSYIIRLVMLLMGAAMVLGSLIGSRVAIKQGARYVRPLFIGVSALLIARQIWTIAAE